MWYTVSLGTYIFYLLHYMGADYAHDLSDQSLLDTILLYHLLSLASHGIIMYSHVGHSHILTT